MSFNSRIYGFIFGQACSRYYFCYFYCVLNLLLGSEHLKIHATMPPRIVLVIIEVYIDIRVLANYVLLHS